MTAVIETVCQKSAALGSIHAMKKSMLRFREWTITTPLRKIPDADFESASPLIAFETGCDGAVIVCHNRDGKATWVPADMWLPGWFTPNG